MENFVNTVDQPISRICFGLVSPTVVLWGGKAPLFMVSPWVGSVAGYDPNKNIKKNCIEQYSHRQLMAVLDPLVKFHLVGKDCSLKMTLG